MNYLDNNFDVTNINGFNNVDGLIDIASYLDFALSTTIHKQLPNVSEQQERAHAATLLKNYLKGDKIGLTRDYNIRDNFSKIGKDKIKFLICKFLIEQDAYNQRVRHLMNPTDPLDQCAAHVTRMVATGNFEQMKDWLDHNIDAFIDEYTSFRYRQDYATKQQYDQMALEQPDTKKAIETLNLEMHMQQIKQR